LLDEQVAAALKTLDARFVIDATHAGGVMKLDVRTLDPDFLVFVTY
jgi:selenocysteine lyase/cysteine desulfurase